ncbi:hypothetical protein [Corynebacterium caspium]|uniref:hypothetical protein n=1 Tax=Corynebacterium caspium TaxID=234828 RepID=UPI00037D3358|nr:hypothetical protein [Corynebacterium caspium]WKD59655.1 hypothetical protein CCASP_06360 [Corynebacterium caspium DSM 44850]
MSEPNLPPYLRQAAQGRLLGNTALKSAVIYRIQDGKILWETGNLFGLLQFCSLVEKLWQGSLSTEIGFGEDLFFQTDKTVIGMRAIAANTLVIALEMQDASGGIAEITELLDRLSARPIAAQPLLPLGASVEYADFISWLERYAAPIPFRTDYTTPTT